MTPPVSSDFLKKVKPASIPYLYFWSISKNSLAKNLMFATIKMKKIHENRNKAPIKFSFLGKLKELIVKSYKANHVIFVLKLSS